VIRLLIAAASPVVRAGLEALAASSPELQLVGSFPDLSGAEDLSPDVVLSSLPWDEVFANHDHARPAIVLLTNQSQPAWAAVTAAASDLAVVPPREMDLLLAAAPPSAAQVAGGSRLTSRELEVLRMIADGAANKIIAWKLGISEHTVKFHVASILAKLGAATRTEAVTIGIRKGLVLL
jgi:two-component system, NarL family, response regulator YdfI